MKYLSGLFFLVSITSTLSHASEDWSHRHLTSKEGVRIDIDFQYSPKCVRFEENGRKDNEIRLADPVWINVSGLDNDDRVEVEIEFWRQSHRLSGSQPPALQRTYKHYDRARNLSPVGQGRYTGQVGSFAVRHSIGSSYEMWRIAQKIRVKVNGYSLVDPVSGTDQFLVFLDDQRGCSYF